MTNVQRVSLSSCIRTHGGFKGIALVVLLILASSVGLYAQSVKVTGVVKDAQQQTLIGVTVKVENGAATTATDINGKFTITVPNKDAVLLFSYIGYQSVKVPLGGKQQITVTMKDQASTLNDVVVVGYGTQKKKDLTGAVAQVSMNDVTKAPVLSVADALAGRVAGVQINSADGQPGSAVNIVIRGANSITQDNTPLYVVDGFPIEGFNLSLLNPQDIESLDVLKDASATAIYGSRGANGVVIITTKKGKAGKPTVNLNVTQSFVDNIKTMQLMNSYDFLRMQIERDPTAGTAANPTPTYVYLTTPNKTLADYQNAPTTDWQSPFFKTGSLRSYYVALRGGTQQTAYSVSGSVDDLDGTVLNTGSKRYQGRISLDQTINDKFKVGINANYSYLTQFGNGLAASTNSGTTNIMYSVWGSNPLSPYSATDEVDPTTASANDYKFNPILNQQNLVRNTNTAALNVNTYLNYNITKNLVLRITGIINNTEIVNENFNNTNTYYGSPNSIVGSQNGVNGSIYTSKNNNWANENTLTWNKNYGKHSLNVLAGFTQQGNTSSTYGFGASHLPNESLGISGLDEGTLNPSLTKALSSLNRLQSWLGRATYNYNSLYYLTASFRADGSSKFAPQNHWGYFPSAAAAWRFSEEQFLKGNRVLSNGKLRLSYGETGNNRVSDFAYLSSTIIDPSYNYSFNNTYATSVVPKTIGNFDLKWETTAQYDVGLDLSFFGDRINFTGDVYRKTTKDLLLNATLPTSSGYSTAYENVGSVQNQGLELTLNTVNIRNKEFSWTSSFNIAFNSNKVLALANGQESLLSSIAWDNGWVNTPGYIARVGQPLGQMYGFVWDGNYQYSDFNKSATGAYVLKDGVPSNGNARVNIQPGDIKYKDLNGDGVINSSDYTVIGRSLPIHQGGFTNNFSYKGFDLSVFFQWSYGNDIQNASRMVFEGNALSKTYLEQFASYNDRWTPTNQGSANYRVNGYFGGGYSSRTIEDGSYLRLKTVQLGYNLPKAWLQKIKISSIRLFVSGQNLYTWTHYSGEDPEVSTYNSVLTGGFDYSAYPRARTFAFGANVNF
ncbi:TonB-linked SusC/RagA family outer membrane protein [Mucilaginibacter yixingensis]|uniref:TonB-linked SusC/RagA family outer membrane protein n=2 Tax=Mucilaginibacter yixingensis TaxID=1295612 RepID=A0A2T5J9D0_9SPHI|nr:TonB-linked SusC/RagA family outer membrane protein [Mucilaginibacter yixingensis]